MVIKEIIEAVEALKRENWEISQIFMSSAYFTEATRIIPTREAKPGEATGLQLVGIPIHIDNLSGYKLIALDAVGFPLLTIDANGVVMMRKDSVK